MTSRSNEKGAPAKGGRGPARGKKPAVSPQVRAKATRLEREAGLPRTLAYQVAMGNVSLSEVLERMARIDQVENLMRRHDLPKSLATQVSLGQADLDQVLVRRRREEHLETNRVRSVLVETLEAGKPLILGLLGQRKLDGQVTAVDQYEFTFQPVKGEVETIHKLQVKYGIDLSQGNKARNVVKAPKVVAAAEPVWKPQDRYGISDKRLFAFHDDELEVQVETSEGDQLRGTVTWMGRWEFGLMTRKGVEVVVFRHALADMKVV